MSEEQISTETAIRQLQLTLMKCAEKDSIAVGDTVTTVRTSQTTVELSNPWDSREARATTMPSCSISIKDGRDCVTRSAQLTLGEYRYLCQLVADRKEQL